MPGLDRQKHRPTDRQRAGVVPDHSVEHRGRVWFRLVRDSTAHPKFVADPTGWPVLVVAKPLKIRGPFVALAARESTISG